ncbi:unnamed protein product [Symbiodinium sp. CCMP2456]|nr:unnamed protein product [Symbiodinium sp. CCMP2456]
MARCLDDMQRLQKLEERIAENDESNLETFGEERIATNDEFNQDTFGEGSDNMFGFEEKKIDPSDAGLYSYIELHDFYSGEYSGLQIMEYWHEVDGVQPSPPKVATAVPSAGLVRQMSVRVGRKKPVCPEICHDLMSLASNSQGGRNE